MHRNHHVWNGSVLRRDESFRWPIGKTRPYGWDDLECDSTFRIEFKQLWQALFQRSSITTSIRRSRKLIDAPVFRFRTRSRRLGNGTLSLDGPILFSVLSAFVFWLLQTVVRRFDSEELLAGLYFQATPSDEMMQTIELDQLARSPLRALWYLHYQPPGFDLLRLLLSLPEIIQGTAVSAAAVDHRLYFTHILFYGAINGIIFFWAQKLTKSLMVAAATATLWAMFPGNIAMATFLDSLYFSAFLVVLVVHLWLLGVVTWKQGYFLGSGLLLIALSWVRTTLQLPFLLVLIALGTWVAWSHKRGARPRRVRVAVVGLVLLAVLLPLKQYLLFDTLSTTSSSGHHLVGMIRHLPTEQQLREASISQSALANSEKFENKFNNSSELTTNQKLTSIFIREVIADPVDSFVNSLVTARRAIVKGAGATQDYQPNTLVNRLPWSGVSRSLFSGMSYFAVVAFGVCLVGFSFIKLSRLGSLSLADLSPVGVFLGIQLIVILFGSMRYSSNLEMGRGFGWLDGFTWTESNRLKFLLEVVILPVAILGWIVGVQRLFQSVVRVNSR